MNKNMLLKKLEQLSLESAPKINFTNEELAYLQTKIRNDQLGLMLNYVEQDPLADSHHIMVKEPKIDLNINLHPNGGGSFLKHQKHHLLIEGDNYHGLLALAHAKVKVDIIYIDPPYNTGSKDFIYNDDFSNDPTPVGHDDPHRHSKWISFMKKRLELAKELLSEEGVIFVSIDDNEQAYLKVLMDEIFGENNFICAFIWKKKTLTNDNNYICRLTEYILFYKIRSVNIKDKKMNNFNDYSLVDEFYNERGKYKLSKLDNASHTWSQKLDYEFVYDGQTYYPGQNKKKWQNRQKGDHASKDWQWMWSKESLLKGIEQKQIVFKNNKIYSKRYQKVDHKLNPILRVTKNSNVIDSVLNSAGTQEIKDLFNKKIFDHPKPSVLIKLLINLCSKSDALILDFFAGTGTTGQAVMELNEEDGGDRRFILITNNESKEKTEQEAKDGQVHPELGICRAITRERLYRVIHGKGSQNEKMKWFYSKKNPSLINNAVRYLQVDYVHKITGEFEDIDKNKSLYKVEFDQNLSILDLK